MGFASKSGSSGLDLNQFEYAYAVEAFDPEATTIKVYIPKLMSNIPAQPKAEAKGVNQAVFCNSSDCKVSSSSSVSAQGFILAKVVDKRYHNHPELQCNNAKYGKDNCPNRVHANGCHHPGGSYLKPCYHDHWHYHFDNEAVGGGFIPAGTRLIVMFMDNNINDCWVTRFLCDYGQRPEIHDGAVFV